MTIILRDLYNLRLSASESKKFTFWPELGIGFFPALEGIYDRAYWEEYKYRDSTPDGEKLTRERIDLVKGFAEPQKTVDIGVGGGRFVKDFLCYGYDINEQAVRWLKSQSLYWLPSQDDMPETACFWDSLEHIEYPEQILNCVKKHVFLSMPIYTGAENVLSSKHFKKGEHVWYFTDAGLKSFMRLHGFEFVSSDTREQPIRQDIVSYHFRRIDD